MSRVLLPLLIFTTILATGCAHRQFINAGDDYLSQGQYQQAIEQYRQASYEKPGDSKTQKKLNQAKALFDNWLDQVNEAARQAENNKLLGKAQLLYAKLAKHRDKLNNRKKKSLLQQQNINNFGLRIKLDIKQSKLTPSFSEELNRINLVDNIDDYKSNEVYLSFSLANINFFTQEYVSIESKEYIYSYKTILNPEYEDIQHDILDLRKDTKKLRVVLKSDEQHKLALYNKMRLLEKDKQIVFLTLQNKTDESTSYYKRKKQIADIQHRLDQIRKEVSETENRLSKRRQKIEKNEHRLDDLYDDLQRTPELVDIPVYADYQYPVDIVNQLATSELSILTQHGLSSAYSRNTDLQIKYVEKSHPSHNIIDLQADPLLLKNDSELAEMLYAKAREEIIYVINNELNQYQLKLISQANEEDEPVLQLDQWLIAGTISKNNLPEYIRSRIRHQLSEEFGRGGKFEIKELLDSDG